MAQDTALIAETVKTTGKITAFGALSTDNANITSDGVNGTLTTAGIVTTNFNVAQQFGGITGGAAGASCTTGGTVSTATRTSKVTTGSAVTGVIIGSGTQDGQELTIVHVGAAASSITFAAAGSAAASSHSATDFVISGQTCSKFVWEVTTALWYPVVF